MKIKNIDFKSFIIGFFTPIIILYAYAFVSRKLRPYNMKRRSKKTSREIENWKNRNK